MRALVSLAAIVVVAFLAGSALTVALGRDGALVALAFFGIAALGGALVAVNDGIARARQRRRPPVVAQVAPIETGGAYGRLMTRRQKQGGRKQQGRRATRGRR